MSGQAPYVIALGAASVDEYYQAGHWPAEGDKTEVRYLFSRVGGMIANAACAISQMGTRCYLADTMNHGGCTEMILEDLRSFGVDTSRICYDDTLPDGKCFVIMSGAERTVFAVVSEKPALTLAAELDFYGGAKYLYSKFLDFSRIDRLSVFMAEMHSRGAQIALDVEEYAHSEAQQEMLAGAGVIFFNEFGAAQYDAALGRREAYRDLFRKHARIIVVTRGRQGCIVHTPQEAFCVPAHRVPATDPTGAGDTFNGSFLSSLCRGEDLRTAARTATAAAALCVMTLGAKNPGLSREKLRKFMEDHPLEVTELERN